MSVGVRQNQRPQRVAAGLLIVSHRKLWVELHLRRLFSLERFDSVAVINWVERAVRLCKLKSWKKLLQRTESPNNSTHIDLHPNARCEECVLAKQMLEHAVMLRNLPDVERSSCFHPVLLRLVHINFHLKRKQKKNQLRDRTKLSRISYICSSSRAAPDSGLSVLPSIARDVAWVQLSALVVRMEIQCHSYDTTLDPPVALLQLEKKYFEINFYDETGDGRKSENNSENDDGTHLRDAGLNS